MSTEMPTKVEVFHVQNAPEGPHEDWKRECSHESAHGKFAPYSAIGFRFKLSLRYPPSKACLRIAIGHFNRKKWECSSDSLRYHRKHSATGVLLHLSRDRGGISVGGVPTTFLNPERSLEERTWVAQTHAKLLIEPQVESSETRMGKAMRISFVSRSPTSARKRMWEVSR